MEKLKRSKSTETINEFFQREDIKKRIIQEVCNELIQKEIKNTSRSTKSSQIDLDKLVK